MKSGTQPKAMEIILLFTYCPLSVAPTNTLTPPPFVVVVVVHFFFLNKQKTLFISF